MGRLGFRPKLMSVSSVIAVLENELHVRRGARSVTYLTI